MKFVFEVDIGDAVFAEDAARELGRILRYWGGNLHHYALEPGAGEAVYDSTGRQAGRWSISPAAGC